MVLKRIVEVQLLAFIAELINSIKGTHLGFGGMPRYKDRVPKLILTLLPPTFTKTLTKPLK
jgi:hypothetical protein